MTHIDMSQSAWSYFRPRRYDPFPVVVPLQCSKNIADSVLPFGIHIVYFVWRNSFEAIGQTPTT